MSARDTATTGARVLRRSGLSRSPEVSGQPWQRIRLGEVGEIRLIRGRGITKKELVTQGVPCLRYADIYTRYENVTEVLTTYVDEGSAAGATALERGDVICAASGETREEIGKAVAWLGSGTAVAGGDTVIIRNHGQDSVFLAYALNSDDAVRQKVSLGKGDAVVHLHAHELARVTVRLPTLPEQRRIAAVLTAADAEIVLHRDLITHLRVRKHSLLEQLLTGEIRIPPRPDTGLGADGDPVSTPTTPPP